MSCHSSPLLNGTFLNPVYQNSFPDPFVLKFRGNYFAYCTDLWRDGRVFGILRSRDLVNWTEIGGAMEKLLNDAPFYWAPEVTYANGRFYMYYSVGNETLMELRVAVSDRPDGGFIDAGKRLTTEDFAIDAHLFTDSDGQRYLFYATDFLEHSHIGTGVVIDRMRDFFTLEGSPRPVTRAQFEWQVYDPQRAEKGGVRWHTVEGPFVLKRKQTYYEMFSGGNWKNVSYGVSFAVTDDIERESEWTQFCDGELRTPILRTIPERIIGPGHNSVIRGPNNRELFCVYHRWTDNGRALAIDRMDFAGRRIFIAGATDSPQIAPLRPALIDEFDNVQRHGKATVTGVWEIDKNEAASGPWGDNFISYETRADSFLAEFYLRGGEVLDEGSHYGFVLRRKDVDTYRFSIRPAENAVFVFDGASERRFELPEGLDLAAFQLARVEVNGRFVRVTILDAGFQIDSLVSVSSDRIALASHQTRAYFSAFVLTEGFEDLFDRENPELVQRGWRKLTEAGICFIENQELYFSNESADNAVLSRSEAFENFEFIVNVRAPASNDDTSYGFVMLNENDDVVFKFSLTGVNGSFVVSHESGAERFDLPPGFTREECHQFRLLNAKGELRLSLEGIQLGAVTSSTAVIKPGLFCRGATVAFDMVRLTVL